MNSTPLSTTASGSSTLGLLLVLGCACWCWFSTGPRFLRWPLVVLLVLLTSGHWAGAIAGAYIDAFAGPLLTLIIVLIGFMIMLRGVGWRPRRRHDYDYHRHGRGFHDRRW